jgi:hypothetical protein
MSGPLLLRCTTRGLLYLGCDLRPWGKLQEAARVHTLLGGAAAVWPIAARVRERMRSIGLLMSAVRGVHAQDMGHPAGRRSQPHDNETNNSRRFMRVTKAEGRPL